MAGATTSVVRAALFALLVLLAMSLMVLATGSVPFIAHYFFVRQDLAAAACVVVALLLLSGRPLAAASLRWRYVRAEPRPGNLVLFIAFAVTLMSATGGWGIFRFYPLSMDEFWVRADGLILATGKPMARIPTEWQPYARALQPIFARLLPESGVWASTYLPVNALIHHVLGAVAGPVMAGLSVLLVADLARTLIPGERHAPVLAALFLASSSQVLITAMTPYAMTAHLFFNLSWLWLFLRHGAAFRIAAMVVALLAMGLHQATFFPLFALPFLFEVFLAGRRGLALAHLLVIGLGFIAWSNYDLVAYWTMQAAPSGEASSGSGWLLGKLVEKLEGFSLAAVGLMALNLLRFQLWQNPMVVPLVLLAAVPLVRRPGPWRALIAGLLLTIVFMLAVIPFQGHGWGYRYLHGLIGSSCLLATHAFYRLHPTAQDPEAVRRWRGFADGLIRVSFAVLLPLHAWQAWRQASPYIAANAWMERVDVDVILVDAPSFAYADDIVRNSPLLDNRPKRIAYSKLAPGQLEVLCRRYEMMLFDDDRAARFGLPQRARPQRSPRSYPAACTF